MPKYSKLPLSIQKLIDRYQFNPIDYFFYKRFHSNSINELHKNQPTILIQCTEEYYYYSIFAEIINQLKKDNFFFTDQLILRSLRPDSSISLIYFIKSRLVFNRFTDNRWAKLYSSFCDRTAFRSDSPLCLEDIKLITKAFRIWRNLKSKEELINMRFDGIYVGDLINDSYLRYKPSPTVDINNIYLLVVIWQCLRTLSQSERYFSRIKPKIFLSSYSTYIQHGIPVRVAIKHGITVFTFGNYQEFTKKLNHNDLVHTASHKNYKEQFSTQEKLENKRSKAERHLLKRTSGGIDTATAYMKKSAYEETGEQVPNVKGAIIIFLHDFFDSPHVYNWMIFPDFYEWLTFTIKIARKNNLKLFIKPHPNQITNSESVVTKIKEQYPDIPFLSTGITNKQLVKAGMGCGVTVYGTVAHELAFLGTQIISCGDNPHISFNLCHHAKNKDEYENLLKNFSSLSIDKKIMKEEALAFYYIRNLNAPPSDIELLSALAEFRNFMTTFSHTHDFSGYETLIQKITSTSYFKAEIEQFKEILNK